MWQIELTGPFSFRSSDDRDELAVLVESHNPGVLITIGDIDVAIGCDENVAGPIEQVVRSVVALDASLPQRHKELSFRSELVNHVLYSVRNPDEPITIDMDAVRPLAELTVAPVSNEFSLRIDNDDGRIGLPPEKKNVSLPVRRHGDW